MLNHFLMSNKINKNGYLWLVTVFFTHLGLGSQTLMTGVLIYAFTDSGLAFASTLGFGFALDLIGQFFGGEFLDRFNPRKTTIFANISRGLLIIAAGMMALSLKNVLGVVIAALYMGIIGPLYRASSFSIPPLIIHHNLPSYNAIRMGMMQIGQLVGLGVSSIMLTFLSKETIFMIVGIWFILGGLTTVFIKGIPERAKSNLSHFSPVVAWKDWLDTIHLFRRTPSVFFHIFVASSGLLIPSFVNLAVVPFNKLLFNMPIGLALLDGGYALGAIIASVVLTKLSRVMQYTRIVINIMLTCSFFVFLGVGWTNHIYIVAAAFFLIGTMATVMSISSDTALQIRMDKDYLGRAALLQDACMSIVALIFLPLIGSMIDIYGIRKATTVEAYVVLFYALLAIICGFQILFGKGMYKHSLTQKM